MSKFKVGDKVRPKHWVDKSYTKNMFHNETGVIVTVHSPYLYTVKRDNDGELFTANEVYWEEATEMDKPINIEEIQILLDLRGEPLNKGDICLSSSHGYYAYMSTEMNEFIYELFMEMSIWGGPTATYKTHDYRYFKQFELDCSVKAFLKSRVFKKICEHHNVNFVILDIGDDDNQIMRAFWDQMRR